MTQPSSGLNNQKMQGTVSDSAIREHRFAPGPDAERRSLGTGGSNPPRLGVLFTADQAPDQMLPTIAYLQETGGGIFRGDKKDLGGGGLFHGPSAAPPGAGGHAGAGHLC